MSRTTEDGRAAKVSALSVRGASGGVARAGRRIRRKPKERVPLLVAESNDPPEPYNVPIPHQRRGLQGIGDFGQPEPEKVENLEKYRPVSRKYQVSLTFSGEAGTSMSDLISKLNVCDPDEVILRAIALLVSVQEKEVLIRDPKTGLVEIVEV